MKSKGPAVKYAEYRKESHRWQSDAEGPNDMTGPLYDPDSVNSVFVGF